MESRITKIKFLLLIPALIFGMNLFAQKTESVNPVTVPGISGSNQEQSVSNHQPSTWLSEGEILQLFNDNSKAVAVPQAQQQSSLASPEQEAAYQQMKTAAATQQASLPHGLKAPTQNGAFNPNNSPSDAMWDILFNWDVPTPFYLYFSVATDGNYLYVSSFGYQGEVRKYDIAGNLIETFTLSGWPAGSYGLISITYDPTSGLFYGSRYDNTIVQMNFTTHAVTQVITTPVAAILHLTFDPGANGGAGGFWCGSWYDIECVSMTGALTLTVPAGNISPYCSAMIGSAYDPWTTLGTPYIWFYAQDGGSYCTLHEWNPATQTFNGVTHSTSDIPGYDPLNSNAGGLFGSASLIPNKFVLLGGMQNASNSTIFCYEMAVTVVYPNDVGIKNLIAPASGNTLGAAEPVIVQIHNYGTNPQTNFPVSFQFQGGPQVVNTYNGAPIQPNADVNFTFTGANSTVNMAKYCDYTFYCCTNLPGDQATANDCKTFVRTHSIPVTTDTLYPLNVPYWTGTTDGSTFTYNSLIQSYGGAVSVGWAKFNISSLGSASSINWVQLRQYYTAPWDYPFFYIKHLTNDPMVGTPATVKTDITNATNYLSITSIVGDPEAYVTHDLPAAANADLMAAIPQGWFAVGYVDYDSYSGYYLTAQGWAQTNRPQLLVNHTSAILNDIGVTTFNLPPYAIANQPFAPQAVIHNFGTNAQTNIPVSITGPAGYTANVVVPALASGGNYTVNFPSGNFPAGANQCFTVTVSLPTDMYCINDNKTSCMQFDAFLTQAYAYVGYDPTSSLPVGPCKFFTQHPAQITSLAPSTTQLISGGAWANGVWYACELYQGYSPYDHGHFYSINTTTGAMTDIGPLGNVAISGLAFDHTTNTMYGIGSDAGNVGEYNTTIYTINLTTGHATPVENAGTQMGLVINLACNNAGMLFAVDIISDVMWSIDPLTWTFEKMGSLGQDFNYAQSASFDKAHDIYYLAGYTSTGIEYTCDVGSAAIAQVGSFQGGSEITGMAIPFSYEIPVTDIGAMWLTYPQSGNLTNYEPVIVKLRNYGTTSQENFNVCYKFAATPVVCEDFSILAGFPLAPGDTYDYAFLTSVDCSNPGNYFVKAWITSIPSDLNKINDTVHKTVRNLACGQITCYPNSIMEVENCGEDINGGCNSTPNAFIDILNGQTFCGTTWKVDTLRDTDWYRFTLTGTKTIAITGRAEMNCDFIIVKLPCSLDSLCANKTFAKCQPDSIISANLYAGTYALVVAHNFGDYNTFCQANTKYTFKFEIRPGKPCIPIGLYHSSTPPYYDEYISNVTFSPGFNNTTDYSPNGYGDYTYITADVNIGSLYSLSFLNGAYAGYWPSDYAGAWIDWNQNYSFNDLNEKVTLNGSPGSLFTGTVTPPANALPGPTVLRCRVDYVSTPDPCATFSYAEAEDYTLIVHTPIPPVLCSAPTLSAPCPGTYCIPITVENCNNVNGITLTLNTDPGVTYLGFQNVNPQLGTGISVSPSGNTIIITWFNANTPANIGNGTLLEICVSTTSGPHTLVWNTCPTCCIFTSVQLGPLTTNYVNGTLTYGNCSDLIGRVRYKHYTNFNAGIIVPYFFRDSVTVQLKQGATVMYSFNVTPSVDSGKYTFTNLANGAYTLTATTNKLWNGGNATDALTILRNFVGIPPLLNGLNLICADVNGSGGIPNSADALAVSRRFVGAISNFLPPNVPSPGGPDWYFDNIPVTITGTANQTINFFGLCAGDVNGSNIPLNTSISPVKQMPTVYLTTEGSLQVDKSVMNVPVYTEKEMSVGAISLVLNYPKNLEITGVSVAGTSDNLVWEAHNGTAKIAWWNLDPLVLKANDVMLTLNVKATSLSSSDMQFTTTEESQISSEEAVTVDNAMLYMPKLTSGINPGDYTLTNFPNPFNNTTEIRYSIPQDGHVVIRVYNVLGEEVATVVNIDQTAGTHVVTFNGTDLKRGVYVYKLEVNNVTKINSMIVSE